MKRYFSVSILAMALALAAPAAWAQLDSSTDTEALSAVLGAGRVAAQIRSLHHVPSVGVIRIDYAFASPFSRQGEQATRLQIFADQNQGAINQLRRALRANPVTRRALAQQGIAVQRIEGVSIGSSGSLRVFVE